MTTPNSDARKRNDLYTRTAGSRIAPLVADALGERVSAVLRAVDGRARLLDVACGAGGLALRLASDLPEASVIGVDISRDVIAQAQRRAAEAELEDRVTFAVMDARQLSFETASIDAATCNLGFHLFARPAEALSEIGRTLKPGARFWASVPDSQSWREFFEVAHDVAPDVDQLLRGYTAKLEQGARLPLALQEAGFVAIQQEDLRLPFAFATGNEAAVFFDGLFSLFATLPANFQERLSHALDERFPQGVKTSYVASLAYARWDSDATPPSA